MVIDYNLLLADNATYKVSDSDGIKSNFIVSIMPLTWPKYYKYCQRRAVMP